MPVNSVITRQTLIQMCLFVLGLAAALYLITQTMVTFTPIRVPDLQKNSPPKAPATPYVLPPGIVISHEPTAADRMQIWHDLNFIKSHQFPPSCGIDLNSTETILLGVTTNGAYLVQKFFIYPSKKFPASSPYTVIRNPSSTDPTNLYLIDGPYTEWDWSGHRISYANYVAGRIHGYAYTWHANGKLRSLTPYQNGSPHGQAREWDSSGRLIPRYLYKNGAM